MGNPIHDMQMMSKHHLNVGCAGMALKAYTRCMAMGVLCVYARICEMQRVGHSGGLYTWSLRRNMVLKMGGKHSKGNGLIMPIFQLLFMSEFS